MNAVSLYRLGLVVVFPLFMAIHGTIWTLHSKSYAPAVYGMKLAFIPFLAVAAVSLFRYLKFSKPLFYFSCVFSTLFVISAVTPFLVGDTINLFYYFTDIAGLAVTVASILVFYMIITRGEFQFTDIERVMAIFLSVVSIYILIYFVFSNGDKVSVTPEMYIPMAIVIGAYLAPISNKSSPSFWLILLIAFGCAFSQLRENLVVYVLIGLMCLVRALFAPSPKSHIALYLVSLLMVGVATPQTQALILDRIASLSISFDTASRGGGGGGGGGRENGSATAGRKESSSLPQFVDGSINQRFVEVDLMLQEMADFPLSFVTGKGFGAEYKNREGVLIYYGDRVHNAHSTPFLVYFRNGIYGLAVYSLPALAAFITIFTKNTLLFRASLIVIITYAAFMVNQYLYWNVQYGLSLALWLHAYRQHQATKAESAFISRNSQSLQL